MKFALDADEIKEGDRSPDALLDRFLAYVRERNLELYPAQEEAILELFEGKNVILNTPTGSGKSLVAAAVHFLSIATGKKSVYTSPIKALVNEKFLALCRDFGPDQVGLATGDATVNRDAPILCCTAEILSNMALRDGNRSAVDDVVMDEFHYYSDRDRGVAWQVPLLTLSRARFLLMSATLGETSFFERTLTELTGKATALVRSSDRPVPLDFEYRETVLEATVQELIAAGKGPMYVVHFTQMDAAQTAQDFLSINFCSREEKAAMRAELETFDFNSPFGKDVRKLLNHGIGLHHAGLLPKYRVLVEKLAQKGMLKVISGTDTLGVGVNVPIRTVIFTRLCKFDGERTGLLTARDFHQISGRAGRKGYDDQGSVVVQAPEHVIENRRLEKKADGDAKKLRKMVRKKPPERGFVPWNEETFQRLIHAAPEPLSSRFQITHGMLLNVLSRRDEDGCRAMRNLIGACHESERARRQLRRTGWQLFRSLFERGIVGFNRDAGRTGEKTIQLNVDLQDDFSLHQTLSLYLIDTVQLLDPAHPEFALDVLSLVEAILENPDHILRRQLDLLKDRKMAEMKAKGMEYDERMAELEEMEYPKPKREFIYETFNAFAAKHPWIGQENIRPKSIAREMFEEGRTFAEYVRAYGLQRIEGVLLRHLSSVYKTLVQTVPEAVRNDDLNAIIVFFEVMIRDVDSSLLDEWEQLRHPDAAAGREKGSPPSPTRPGDTAKPVRTDITRNREAFFALVRSEVFRVLRLLEQNQFEQALQRLKNEAPADGEEGAPATPGGADRLGEWMQAYRTDHERIRLDPDARHSRHTHLVRGENDNPDWRVSQTLVDPEDQNDWTADFVVHLHESRESQRPVLSLESIGPIGAGTGAAG